MYKKHEVCPGRVHTDSRCVQHAGDAQGRGLLCGNIGRPGSPGCHEESAARMVKANLLTLGASSRRLK